MKKLRIVQLIAIIFFTVSGGPYGLEPLLGFAGQHGALLILLVTPLLWDIPAIFTVLELNSMMPITGGYYQWVKLALGRRWGFYEGWWTWLYTFIDLAIYPVLFVQYASFFYAGLNDYKIPICLLIIWSSAGLNILGIMQVGRASLILSAIVLSPFLIMFVFFFYHHTGFSLPAPSLKGIPFSSLGMALYTVMWNCLGWDNVTTYAEEVENPVKSYLIGIFVAFVLVIAVYFLAIVVAQQSGINAGQLNKGLFPALGVIAGGHWLGAIIAIGGMASFLGIYASVLLSVSKVPKVMADDKLLPPILTKLHPKFQTPYVSIILCSLVVSLMVLWKFEDLIIIDVIVYGAGLFLEYVSLVKFRITQPLTIRPFRIPLNVISLCLVILLPVGVYCVALVGALISARQGLKPAIFALVCLLTAEIAWQLTKVKKSAVNKLVSNVKNRLSKDN